MRVLFIFVPDDIILNMSELSEYYIEQEIKNTAMTAQVAKLFIGCIVETSLGFFLLYYYYIICFHILHYNSNRMYIIFSWE